MTQRLAVGEAGEVFFQPAPGDRICALVYLRDRTGKRRRVKAVATSKRAAKAAVLAKVEAALRLGGSDFKPASTLADVAGAWLRSVEVLVAEGARSPATLDTYRSTVNAHVLPVLGNLRLPEFDVGVFEDFLLAVRVDKSLATAKLCRTVLSGVCGMLVRRRVLTTNPMRDVGRLEGSKARKPQRALPREDVVEWLSVVDADDYARARDLPDLLRLLLGTGLRVGEALGLSWDEVDLERGVLVVEWTVIRATGRGLIRKNTKGAASDRTLLLPTWCLEMLRRRKLTSGAWEVFPSSRGGWRDRSAVGKEIRRVREGTRFDRFVSHDARRTVATLLDGQGLSARDVADLLGHSRTSMTQDFYMGRRLPNVAAAQTLDVLLSPETFGQS